jgi:hypothetical protein
MHSDTNYSLCQTEHVVLFMQVYIHTGDQIPGEARFSAPVQTGPGTHPPSVQ